MNARSNWDRPAINHGTMAYEKLPRAEAERYVTAACMRRQERRELEEAPTVSEAEIDLVAALLFIGAHDFALQAPVGPYDADICFFNENLVVEVDGRDFHDQKRDTARDRYMAREYGLKTVRIPASQVWRDPIAMAKFVAAQVGLQRRELRKTA